MEPEYQLPDAGLAGYLVDALTEIGEAKFTGEHITSIGWIEISAWMAATKSNLTPGEAVALRNLSSVYVTQHYLSLDAACVSPNIEKPKDPEIVAGKMKNLFAMLRN